MNLRLVEYDRPSGYSSEEWNTIDVFYNMGNKFICFISTDRNMVALEMQNCDEIIKSNFYKSDIELDVNDKDDIVAFWSHKEAKRMLNE